MGSKLTDRMQPAGGAGNALENHGPGSTVSQVERRRRPRPCLASRGEPAAQWSHPMDKHRPAPRQMARSKPESGVQRGKTVRPSGRTATRAAAGPSRAGSGSRQVHPRTFQPILRTDQEVAAIDTQKTNHAGPTTARPRFPGKTGHAVQRRLSDPQYNHLQLAAILSPVPGKINRPGASPPRPGRGQPTRRGAHPNVFFGTEQPAS